ncbi:MAG: tetratricopeptide repeat protein, partial [Flavobacterium sp.]|nr:tetratricopeptide repeat protein [Flavobacterium sp.]
MQIKSWLFLLLLAAGTSASAQKSEIYTNDLSEYNRALELYKDSQYQSAQILFEKIKTETQHSDIEADAAYYIANTAIRLEQQGADQLMEDFVTDYPTSTKQNQAFIEVAHYYFDQGRYPQALEYFERVDENTLNAADRQKFNFQKGYALFAGGKQKEATPYFNAVVNSKEYGSQAKYYLGFMAYEGDNYQEASKYFDEVAGEEKYKEKLSYFQADMSFKSGDFQKAIEQGKTAMAKSTAA